MILLIFFKILLFKKIIKIVKNKKKKNFFLILNLIYCSKNKKLKIQMRNFLKFIKQFHNLQILKDDQEIF